MGVGRRGGAPGCRATAAGARLGGRWPAARSLSRPRWKVVPSGVPATRELEAVPVPVPRERLVEPLQSAIRQLGIAPDARNILAHDARGHPTRDTQHVQRLPLIHVRRHRGLQIPLQFVWSTTVDTILDKVKKCKVILGTHH